MQNQRLPKIDMAKSGNKRSRFNFSHDVNTTADFGVVQPAMCKMIVPGSKTTLNTESLTRLAPMVAPTFGRLKYKMWHQFVELRDICEQFDATMAQQPLFSAFTQQTFVPREVPSVPLRCLSSLCFVGARATVYRRDVYNGSGWNYEYTSFKNTSSTDLAELQTICEGLRATTSATSARVFPIGYGTQDDFLTTSGDHFFLGLGDTISSGSGNNRYGIARQDGTFGGWLAPSGSSTGYFRVPLHNAIDSSISGGGKYMDLGFVYANGELWNDPVMPDSADFLFEFSGYYNNTQYNYVIAFRFSDFGKRIRKILIGLGYQVDLTNGRFVSLLPLFAFYKAYWNVFGLSQWQDWQQTSCAKLIRLLNSATPYLNYFTDPSSLYGSSKGELIQFISDLADCFITDSADFVSAHLPSTAISPDCLLHNEFIDVPNARIIDSDSSGGVNGNSPISGNGHAYIDTINHGALDEEYLKRLYKWTNRNTIIGRRIAELLKAQGLGKFVDECKSDFIGYTEDVVTISDVVSTADTLTASGGASLGEFGGKGVQYTKGKNFTFENDNFGFWVTLSAIVPESGYSQQMDGVNFAIRKLDFYNPEFDSLGYSGSPKCLVQGAKDDNNGIGDLNTNFGFKPLYFEYKFAQNVTNGDMSLRSTRSNYLPYFLDRFMVLNDRYYLHDSSDDAKFFVRTLFTSGQLPTAGNVWRYPTKFKWLGNLKRIFADQSNGNEIGYYDSGFSITNDKAYFCDNSYDDFLIHNIFDMTCYAPMLAVEDSFETTDDDEKPNMSIGKA